MGTIEIVTYRFEVVVGMHFRNSKSTALFLLEQLQLFSTSPYLIELLYEQGISQSEKKKRKRKRNPDDSIFFITEGKASCKFSGVYDVITTGKIDLPF